MRKKNLLLNTIWQKEQENPWDMQQRLYRYLVTSSHSNVLFIHEYECVKRTELPYEKSIFLWPLVNFFWKLFGMSALFLLFGLWASCLCGEVCSPAATTMELKHSRKADIRRFGLLLLSKSLNNFDIANVVREESRHREKKGGSQVTARARERERRRYSM